MNHVQTLLMNVVRDAMEQLQKTGVGNISGEVTGKIFYQIDDKDFCIEVKELSHHE